MAEPVIGGNGSKPPKEMSMEVRLLLAFVLMGAVMFVSQYFFKSQTPPAAQKTALMAMRRNPSLPNWQVNQESLTHTSGLIELDPALKACSGLELIPRAACNTNPHAPSS